MIELNSTPIVLMIILGVAGMLIPGINVARKEKGSTNFYGAIAFGALILSMIYVVYQFKYFLLRFSQSYPKQMVS